MDTNIVLEKKLNLIAYIVSAVVLLVVMGMRYIKLNIGIDFSFLPPFHATVNALTAVVLLFSFYFIKNGNVHAHRRMNYVAMILSAIFLVSYVLYHITTPETRFGGVGTIRYVYFFFLSTHILLAAIILPFVLVTFNRAYTGSYDRHKKLARWVFPFWLYVAVTGPICYVMLMPYY